MEGDIWVESQSDVGSTFSFTVRLGKQQDGALLQTKSDDTDIKQSIQVLSGCKILLVEDNEINQEVIGALLAEHGIMIITVNNGAEALEIISSQDFDGVLMDCMMPVMDGYETTRQIRAQERFKDLPIIALTANAMKQDIEEVLSVGMNDHIAKPIVPDTMLTTMAKLFQPKTPISDSNIEKK